MMTKVFSLEAENKEEFKVLVTKMLTTLERWGNKYPKFDYAFVGSTETLIIDIEIVYNESNTEDNTQHSEGNISGEESTIKGRFRDSDFSV